MKDNNYFETIDTEHKAYHLGFLFADGNVSKLDGKRKMYRIKIFIHTKDIEYIKAYKKDLNLPNNYYFSKIQEAVEFSHKNKKLHSDLIKHGCVPKKSLILKPPTQLPKKMVPHFIRGFFDGDGCICVYKEASRKHLKCAVEFIGTKEMMEWVAQHLSITNKLQHRPGDKNTYTVKARSAQAIFDIHNYLYKDSTIYLSRKKKTFQRAIQVSGRRLNRIAA